MSGGRVMVPGADDYLAPEARARIEIDEMLEAAGWAVQDYGAMALGTSMGVAVREFPMAKGHGVADYLLFVNRLAVGVIEAKKPGTTLTGVEYQSRKYTEGLPEALDAIARPLRFAYETTGRPETRFTNGLDPEPQSRRVFSFHRPETLIEMLGIAIMPCVERRKTCSTFYRERARCSDQQH